MEVDQIQQMLSGAFFSMANLLRQYADSLTAAFVLLLGYRLMKIGILRHSSPGSSFSMPAYVAMVAPGAVLALVGAAFMFDRGPVTLLLCLLIVTVVVGLGVAFLGYRLLQGVAAAAEPQGLGSDRGLLLRRAAPGAVFAVVGLALITSALVKAPAIVREYQGALQQANEELSTAVDTRLAELTDEVRAARTPVRQVAAETATGSRPQAETRSPR